jgi:hypothetical protein
MRGLFLLILLLVVYLAFAQEHYPKKYFSSPIDKKLSISSNFGKIRTNHFHAGLDINTNLKSGINIYAAAEGYISRVYISSGSYGKAIYITHPNGYVTVYGHLSQVERRVSDSVNQIQHQRHQFKVDLTFPPGKFPVKKGQIIGKSGNTGQSFGAHLHFEIREQESEKIVNPLLFGFDVPDNEAPDIKAIYLYRFLDENKHEDYKEKHKLKIKEGDTIISFGKLGLGLEMCDYLSKKKGNLDVYQLKLLLDDSLIFYYKFDKFSFDESKYINSFIDYGEMQRSGKKIIKCYIEPNNKLSIYKTSQSGIFNFVDDQLHKLNISASDVNGNVKKFTFYIKSDSSQVLIAPGRNQSIAKRIDYSKVEEFATDSFRIIFNESCLYDDLDFKYFVSHGAASGFSKYHYVHNPTVPLHNNAIIEIRPNHIPDSLKSKAVIAGVGHKGSLFSVGGTWNSDFIRANISNFGTYFVTIDTIPPTIQPIVLKTVKNKKPNFINLKIKDDLSGIEEYVGFIDNNWVLFEYDEKSDLISCNLSKEKIFGGNHYLIVWLRDRCNNLTIYESNFKN